MLRQVEIGQTYPVIYRPSRLPASAPTVTFEANGTTSAVVLSAVASSFAVQVTGDYTLAAPDGGPALDPASLRGVTGEVAGDAWLDLAADGGSYPVRILRVSSTTVFLDPTGPNLPYGAEGTIHPNVWSGTLASGAIGADVDRAGRWYVRYTADDGADAPGEAVTETGSLRLVRYRFDTGLSEQSVRRDPRLPYHRLQGAFSWREMVATTLPTLIRDIETIIGAQTPRFADQTTASQWRFAHGLLLVAELVEAGILTDPQAPENSARVRYKRELKRVADRVAWIDSDDDGVIDDDELQTAGFDPSVMTFTHGAARYAAIQAGTENQIPFGLDER